MHLDPSTLAPHLPDLWHQLDVHDRICIILEQYQVDHSQEMVESVLTFEVAEVLREAALDVRVIEWVLTSKAHAPAREIKLHALQLDGVDWENGGNVGQTQMRAQWARQYFPKALPGEVIATRQGDVTSDLRGHSDWLYKLIAQPLRELIVQLEEQHIQQSTQAARSSRHGSRL